MIVYDLTLPIRPDSIVFPGDPAFEIERIQSLDQGDRYDLRYIHMSNHMGTHIDYPAHVIKGGKTSSDFLLQHLIGEGVIINVPEAEANYTSGITAEFVKEQPILKNDFVFFKANARLDKNKYCDNFVFLSPAAAIELAKKQVKIVGIDCLSVDNIADEELQTHHALLSKEILIVENLDLSNVPCGRFSEISIIPLNIPNMDGLPARVFARK